MIVKLDRVGKLEKPHVGLSILMNNIPYIVLFILIIWNCIFTNNFFRLSTLWNATFQCATTMIASMGMMLVIATGGIDISMGAMVGFAGMLATITMRDGSILIGVTVALLLGLAGGAINGIFVGRFRIQAMIVTLSTMYIFRGIAKLISGGSNISTRQPDFNNLTYIKLGSIPIQLVISAVVVIIMFILVNKTAYGLKVNACGDNSRASEMGGIKVWKVIFSVYVFASTMAAFAGLMEISMATGADPNNMGIGMELDAIAAVALGGTPMNGGKPQVLGTVAGVLILQIISMMINMNNVPYAYSLAIKAGILVASLLLQRLKNRLP